MELATPAEQEEMQRALFEKLQFFHEMEHNMKKKFELAQMKTSSKGPADECIAEASSLDYDRRGRSRFNSNSGTVRTVRTISSISIEDWEFIESSKPLKSSSGGASREHKPALTPTHATPSFKEDLPWSIQFHINGNSFMGDDAKISYREANSCKQQSYDRKSEHLLGSFDLAPHCDSKLSYTDGDTAHFRSFREPSSDKSKSSSSSLSTVNRKRRNSTGTMYVKNTMSVQDNDATIMCVCAVIRAHIVHSTRKNLYPTKSFDIFLDNSRKQSNDIVPTLKEIMDFFTLVFSKSQLESECIIIALIYCERLVKETEGRLCFRSNNWRSIVFACLVMASKVWDDLSMWNVDFSQVCSSFDLQKVNAFELTLLDALGYVIRVPASEYAKYYFHLRSLMTRLAPRDDPRPALNLVDARRLQLASERYQVSQTVTGGAGGSQKKAPLATAASGSTSFIEALSPGNSFRVNRCRSYDNLDDDLFHHVTIGFEQIIHVDHNDADGAAHKSTHK